MHCKTIQLFSRAQEFVYAIQNALSGSSAHILLHQWPPSTYQVLSLADLTRVPDLPLASHLYIWDREFTPNAFEGDIRFGADLGIVSCLLPRIWGNCLEASHVAVNPVLAGGLPATWATGTFEKVKKELFKCSCTPVYFFDGRLHPGLRYTPGAALWEEEGNILSEGCANDNQRCYIRVPAE